MDEFAAPEELSSGYHFAKECSIRVVGVGSGGCTLLQYLINAQLRNAHLLDFVAVDSDSAVLARSTAPCKIQIGADFGSDLGSGNASGVAYAAANRACAELEQALRGSDLIFLVTALDNAADVQCAVRIAQSAQNEGALTLAFVIKSNADAQAEIAQLKDAVDSIFVIDQEKINSSVVGVDLDAFIHAWVFDAIKAIVAIDYEGGYIALGYEDLLVIMRRRGYACFGQGFGRGANFIQDAVQRAVHAPLLEQADVKSATGLIVKTYVNRNFPLVKWEQINHEIQEYFDEEADCKFGLVFDDQMAEDQMVVTLFVSGLAEPLQA